MDAVLFIAAVVCLILLIIFALAVGFTCGGWERILESIGLAMLILELL